MSQSFYGTGSVQLVTPVSVDHRSTSGFLPGLQALGYSAPSDSTNFRHERDENRTCSLSKTYFDSETNLALGHSGHARSNIATPEFTVSALPPPNGGQNGATSTLLASKAEIDHWMTTNQRDLDEEASALFIGLSAEDQGRVIDAGALAGCRNVVAVIKSRLRPRNTHGSQKDLESFLQANARWMSSEAEQLLRVLEPADLERVLAGGSLYNSRDAAGVVRSRLRGGPTPGRDNLKETTQVGDVATFDNPWANFAPACNTAGSSASRFGSPRRGRDDANNSVSSAGQGQERAGHRRDAADNDQVGSLQEAANRGRSLGREERTRASDIPLRTGPGPGAPDPWAEFRARAVARAGIPIAPPLHTAGRALSAPPKPQLRTGHIPVILHATLDALLSPGLPGTYVDGTFGRGGHSTEILKRLPPGGRLVAFDVDPYAIAVGRELEKQDSRFKIVHRPFGDIGDVFKGQTLAGVLIDIGFSSPQVDEQHRGFSVVDDGPLDLRMNPECGEPFADWLLKASVEEVAWIVREWGEDDDPIICLRIAEAVLETQRRCGRYASTLDVAEVIRQVKMGQDDRGQHPAKLPFQGFRVFLNQEMPQLDAFMEASVPLLQPGGRALIITFKRPEAVAVKQFLRNHEEPPAAFHGVLSLERLRALYPLLKTDKPFAARQVCAPLVPTQAEISLNRRSRSSMTHVLERLERAFPVAQMLVAPPTLPIAKLFKRPAAVWRRRGDQVAQAALPARYSGSIACSVLTADDAFC